MNIPLLFKVAIVFLLFTFSSCPDELDCIADYKLPSPLLKEMEYTVWVTNADESPVVGIDVEMHFQMKGCDGEIYSNYILDSKTDKEGIISGGLFFAYYNQEDHGTWIVDVFDPTGQFFFKTYREKFDKSTFSLTKTFKVRIIDLED